MVLMRKSRTFCVKVLFVLGLEWFVGVLFFFIAPL